VALSHEAELVALSHLWLNRAMAGELLQARIDVARSSLPEMASFYGDRLGLPTTTDVDGVCVEVGESLVELRGAEGEPFYHVALLVPGDRFDAALAWAAKRVELLPERASADVVFDFEFWDALACYFHDPAGTIVELIAHRGLCEAGTTGPFGAGELLGLSELGIVGDPPVDAAALEQELGLELWDGGVEGERSLAFVGEKARTLILCRAGRPWLPTGRPAEAWPLDVIVAGGPVGKVAVGARSRVSRRDATAAVQAS
jgi:hypothetical protein